MCNVADPTCSVFVNVPPLPSNDLEPFHVPQVWHRLGQLLGEELRQVDVATCAVGFCRHGSGPLLAAPQMRRQGGQLLAASPTQWAMKVRLQGVGAFVLAQLYLPTCGHDTPVSACFIDSFSLSAGTCVYFSWNWKQFQAYKQLLFPAGVVICTNNSQTSVHKLY